VTEGTDMAPWNGPNNSMYREEYCFGETITMQNSTVSFAAPGVLENKTAKIEPGLFPPATSFF